MLCQKCGKNEATNYYEYNINGKKTQMYLCPQCAHEAGLDQFNPLQDWGFAGFTMPSLLFSQGMLGLGGQQAPAGAGRVCSCGATEAEIRRTGRPGCAECYHTFADLFEPMVRRIHGSARHTGSVPKNIEVSQTAKLERLNAELSEAIAKQEFEKAAQLRDAIKEIQNQEGGQGE